MLAIGNLSLNGGSTSLHAMRAIRASCVASSGVIAGGRRQLCSTPRRRGASEAARERIRRIDEADRERLERHRHLEALSLSSDHEVELLKQLCATATLVELETADGGKDFLLHHADAPGARLAELKLLPPVPDVLMGRFDAGLNGSAGIGPTLSGAAAHRGLPLGTASPLLKHALQSLSTAEASDGPVEAVAALPGLCAWVATLPDDVLNSAFGAEAGRAVAAIAAGQLPASRRAATLRTARLAWEALATRFAEADEAEEASLYRAAGAMPAGIAYMADPSAAGMAASGGAMALFAFPAAAGPGSPGPLTPPSG